MYVFKKNARQISNVEIESLNIYANLKCNFTFPEQAPYVARHPAQQKQNPGGFVRASAE